MPTLQHWQVEDPAFWEATGRRVAWRNLAVSIPNLLCGFAIWLYWGMIASFLRKIHAADPALFDFLREAGTEVNQPGSYAALVLTLPAIAGLVGATMRIPNSFVVALCGGRNVIALSSTLLVLPALGTGLALRDPRAPFWLLAVLSALSGIGGGAFASSMSNISAFFPKRMQGLALGLNAGLGNLGVSVMQFLIPWVITFPLFGPLSGDPQVLPAADAGPGGKATSWWIQNTGLVWVPILAVLAVLAWTLMNNLTTRPLLPAAARFAWLSILGLAGSATGVAILLVEMPAVPELVKTAAALAATMAVTLGCMHYLTPAEMRHGIERQFGIFRNKHNWVMTWLYTMTFGSFIGYANAFPVLIDVVFGQIGVAPDGTPLAQAVPNPAAPASASYIWIGAGVGALIRPLGGWLSDKFGGARVTQYDTWLMLACTLLAGYLVYRARLSPRPETYFVPFLVTFVALFATTGIGNGSTFRMIPMIFSKEEAGPVLGWTSAVAAYGAYLIPKILGTQIGAGRPENALYAFALYYASCLVVTWWYYLRSTAEIRC